MYYYSSDDSSAGGYGYDSGPEDSGDDGEYAEDSGDEGFPSCHVCDRVFNRGNSWRDYEHARMQHMKVSFNILFLLIIRGGGILLGKSWTANKSSILELELFSPYFVQT